MARLKRYGQAVGTLNIHPAGGGDSRDVLDAKINAKLAEEDWDEVSAKVIHINRTNEEVTSVIIMYEYKKYEDGEGEVVSKAKK